MAVSLRAQDLARIDERARSDAERALILRLASDDETVALDYLYPYAAVVEDPFTCKAYVVGTLVLSAIQTRSDGELVAYLAGAQTESAAETSLLAQLFHVNTGVRLRMEG